MMPLSSGPFTISWSSTMELRRLRACIVEQNHSEFQAVAFTTQTDKMIVADGWQSLWKESVATSLKLRNPYFICQVFFVPSCPACCSFPTRGMKAYWVMESQIHSFYAKALRKGAWTVSFTPRPLYLWWKNPVPIELEVVQFSELACPYVVLNPEPPDQWSSHCSYCIIGDAQAAEGVR